MTKTDEWKNWLLTLPEKAFFGLVRNYLGARKTPFNKHHIFEELSGFLSRPTVQTVLAGSLDELDHRILSIVSLLGFSTEAPVLDLLTDRWTPWALRQRLTNLQERLLLYKDQRDIYFITPPLEDFFCSRVIRMDYLFPQSPSSAEEKTLPWLNDDLLVAFRSYLQHTPPNLKTDGTPTKKSQDIQAALFPFFAPFPEKWELLLGALRVEGLWEMDESRRWRLNPQGWEPLRDLSPRHRLCRLWARAILEKTDFEHPWTLRQVEYLIESLEKTLRPDTLYATESLTNIIMLILFRERPRRKDIPAIIEGLTALDILHNHEGEYGINAPLLPPSGESSPVLHPNFELTLPPGNRFSDNITLADTFELERFERIGQYLLNQESYSRGRRHHPKGWSLSDLLQDRTGHSLPQNISFTLDHWDNQIRSVRLLEGIILKVSADKIPFFENNPLLRPHIRETLAPGVYLLNGEERHQWEQILLKTGITALPAVETTTTDLPNSYQPPLPPLPEGVTLTVHRAPPEAYPPVDQEALHARLEKIDLSETEREELGDRIEKKVILFPEQIRKEITSREIREAKGLDYQAKVRLIQEALSTGQEYLQLSWFSPEDEMLTRGVIPRHLGKEEDTLILSGHLLSQPGQGDFHIPVKKISKVKRRKLSFFSLKS